MKRNARVFLPPSSEHSRLGWQVGDSAVLSERDSHHIANVLRIVAGSTIDAVCTFSGKVFEASITATEPLVKLSLDSLCVQASGHTRSDTLIAPLIKGDRLDWMVEKSCELGIGELRLYQAARSVVKLSDQAASKLTRWSRIAEAASKQSSRVDVPEVSFAHSLSEAIHTAPPGIYGSLESGTPVFSRLTQPKSPQISLVVGPEGDFSSEEIALLKQHNYLPVSLGSLVLRAETAAIVLLATVNAIWGEPSTHEVP